MERSSLPILAVVVPCYNEESILAGSIQILLQKLDEMLQMKMISEQSFLLCVDDGSKDRTWEIISKAAHDHPDRVQGLRLSNNCGHQNALTAGLQYAADHSDASISIDADLQDDVEVLRQFVEEYNHGADIVYGVRNDRSSDSVFKRLFAELFYKLMQWLGAKTVYNHADFRLMSKAAMQALMEYPEVNLYLRGLVPLLGFRQAMVFYKRKATDRPTHYPITKMFRLAWDGITSFSVRPIRLISMLGGLFLLFCAVYTGYVIYRYCQGQTAAGWPSMVCLLLLIGGIQLISIGIIGEYIAKTYMETKHRPRFHIQEKL